VAEFQVVKSADPSLVIPGGTSESKGCNPLSPTASFRQGVPESRCQGWQKQPGAESWRLRFAPPRDAILQDLPRPPHHRCGSRSG